MASSEPYGLGVRAGSLEKPGVEIAELVARLAPQPDVPATLRALPRRREPVAMTMPAPSPAQPLPSPAQLAPKPPSRPPDPAPLSLGRYRLQVTLGQAARDKLKQLQDLLAHQIPNGDAAAIVERALDALWTQVHKRKTGITAKPRSGKPSRRHSGATDAPSREAPPLDAS